MTSVLLLCAAVTRGVCPPQCHCSTGRLEAAMQAYVSKYLPSMGQRLEAAMQAYVSKYLPSMAQQLQPAPEAAMQACA